MVEKKNEKALVCANSIIFASSKDKLRLFRLVVIDLDFLVQS